MAAQPLRVLIYDEDRISESFLKEFAPIFNFSFEIEGDLEEVSDKLAEKRFNALVLVEKENPNRLFAFLSSNLSLRIAYCAKLSTDAKSFRKLKQELHVEYVLQQPLDKNEMAALFRNLCFHKDEAETKKEYLTPELLEKYKEKIFEKVERIEELVSKIGTSADLKADLLEIRNEIHKITGNAAPYGFPEAGKLCGSHEIYLYNLYSGTIVREVQEIILHNELFLRKLKLFFQKIFPRAEKKPEFLGGEAEPSEWQRRATDQKSESIRIHLITADFDLARYFQSAAAKKHISLAIEDNPNTYLQNFASLEEAPHIILVEEHFPFIKLNGIDLIKALQARQTNKNSLFGILTDWDNLEKRMEWMNKGVDLVIKKPITDANIEYILTHALMKKTDTQAKVLILDDDEEQGLLMKSAFETVHISAIYLQDEGNLFAILEEFVPDLLILDIQMPKYNGRLLLSALRDDIRFKKLLIVIVTALSSCEVDEWAYQAKCDAIIHKPVNIPIFLARISSLLERQREYFSFQEIDSLTGLLLWKPFLQQVEDFVAQGPKETKCMFVLLEIGQWNNLTSVLNKREVQQILLLFSELLKTHFFSSLFKGMFKNGYFAFLFKDLSGGEIEFLMESFFEKIGSKIWLSSQTQLKITANSAAILFVSGDVVLKQVIEEAKQALNASQEAGPNRIEIRRMGEQASLPTQAKKVILVDDDLDLCDIIQFAFEKHGVMTKVFHNAADALHFFAQLPNLESNTLIILDRRLPDGDGIDILRKIQDKFSGNVKAIFLSSLSNEKEILEALRTGALDYITKPFSTEVLIEKAAILLSR